MGEPSTKVAQILKDLMGDNAALLRKKGNNIVSKMRHAVALQRVVLQWKDEMWEEEVFGFKQDSSTDAFNKKGWLLAAKSHKWVWDDNGWPFPCLPTFVLPFKDSFIVKLVKLSALMEKGVKSISSLGDFMAARKDKKLLSDIESMDFVVEEGSAL